MSAPGRTQARNPQHAWVRNGVQAGETVVLYPGAGIGDGQRVRRQRRSASGGMDSTRMYC